MTQVHFITVVWGERFTEALLSVIMPSQVAESNLPAFCGSPVRATYRIFTTERDAETIRKAPIFRVLSAILSVEFILIDDVLRHRKYEAMAECHCRAIRNANDADAALVFLSPDLILSAGSLRRLREIYDSGKRVVVLAGIRVVAETFVPWFRGLGSPALPPRELMKTALEQMHPFTRSCFWDSPEFTRWPSNIYWRVGDEGYVARAYHFHPLLVRPSKKVEPRGTIDDDYIPLACPNLDEWYVVEDTDEILIVDITGSAEFAEIRVPNRAAERDVAFWAQIHALPYHRRLSARTLRFHSGRSSPAWTEVEKSADAVMKRIDEFLASPCRHFGPRMVLRSLGQLLKKPIQLLFGRSRIERIRRKLGV
jgi:hypothetical protein